VNENNINWFHANMVQMGDPLPEASAIEFLTYYEAEWRDTQWNGKGKRLAPENNLIVMQTGLGVAHKPLGIIDGANCLSFGIGSLASGGPRPIGKMRTAVFNRPSNVARFIATGM